MAIEGPGNIDAGLRRLDTFFTSQLLALGFAVIAAFAGFAFADAARRTRLIGLLPIGLTALVVIMSTAAFMLFDDADQPRSASDSAPTVPAETKGTQPVATE